MTPDDQLSPHFKRSEFRCPCCGWSEPDPDLVSGLEALREAIGKPIRVTSGCRCIDHNRAVRGAVGSRHVTGQAADIVVASMTARELYAYAAALQVFGGLGVDDATGMLHCDVRPMTKASRWCYRDGRQSPWSDSPSSASSA